MDKDRSGRSSGHYSRQSAVEPVYGIVSSKDIPMGEQPFFFAQTPDGRKIFLHKNGGCKIEGTHHDGTPNLVQNEEIRRPEPNDCVFALVVEGDRGLRAIRWIYDERRLAFRYHYDVVTGWRGDRSLLGA